VGEIAVGIQENLVDTFLETFARLGDTSWVEVIRG